MNNAEAAGNRLVVILNDNDMSIAPPVGGLSHYLARLVSSRKYLTLRHLAQQLRPQAAQAAPRSWPGDGRNIGRGFCDRRHALRGTGLLLCRPGRRPQCRAAGQDPRECPRRRRGADAGPCRHQEGQGLCARPRRRPTNITASRSSTSSRASRPRPSRARRAYTARLRQGADRGGGARRQGGRDHRGDAVRHRPRQVRRAHSPTGCSTSASPSSTRVTFAAGLAAQGMRPVLRHLFDLPPARLRPGRPRRRDPESAGPLRDRPRRPGRRRRRDPCRQLRPHLSRAPCPISW